MQPNLTGGRAFLCNCAIEEKGPLVSCRQGGAVSDECAKFGHLGDHHGHHFDDAHLFFGVGAHFF